MVPAQLPGSLATAVAQTSTSVPQWLRRKSIATLRRWQQASAHSNVHECCPTNFRCARHFRSLSEIVPQPASVSICPSKHLAHTESSLGSIHAHWNALKRSEEHTSD